MKLDSDVYQDSDLPLTNSRIAHALMSLEWRRFSILTLGFFVMYFMVVLIRNFDIGVSLSWI